MSNLARVLINKPEFLSEIAKYGYVSAKETETEVKTNSAKRMLSQGVDPSDIASYLDIPISRVNEIKLQLEN